MIEDIEQPHESEEKDSSNLSDSITVKEEVRSIKHLSGMFEKWFLDYASYVILERAVPYVNDGLKPVQRRILHAMKQLDDGRYNKVANIIGHTMQYHPHGDASIGDALVQLGQKDLLIDCQGNWGNILTGDSAAASRYIEARLSKFALDVVFNPKTTNWKQSYDGRNREPVTLPVKFPLLLAQGVEGIAVGLASKILPHNFIELIDACIAHLKGEPFELYPDFPTRGMIDVSRYNDGLRGGVVKVRAKIEKDDKNKILKITEIPYGRTTSSLIESIIKANEKGKIKIKKIDDNTAADVEILIYLANGISLDKTIDALYAFTDCELSISPNSCVIDGDKPHFKPISAILRASADDTLKLTKMEQEILLAELLENLHFVALERIFIEERIYKDKKFEESKDIDTVIAHVRSRLEPFVGQLYRVVTDDDIKKLLEIKMKRILKFNSDEANQHMADIEADILKTKHNIEHIVDFTIDYYKRIREKYSKGRERRTEIRSFENIEATKVVIANQKLYINKADGFAGTGLKKDEFVCECSDLDDIIVIKKDGTYYVTKVADKLFVGQDVEYINVFKKNDTRTIYNVAYRDGRMGRTFVKRFAVTGVTRDKPYNLTQGTMGSRILYFSANPNGEAEKIKVCLKQRMGIRKPVFEYDFADLAIKNRASQGNILSREPILKISTLQKGVSTLGGRKIWFDKDVLRLNTDGRGDYLGEFEGDDKILVINKDGSFYTSNFDLTNHYAEGYLRIEKFDPDKVWSLVYYDADQDYYYLKRFKMEESAKPVRMTGDNEKSYLLLLSDAVNATFELVFGGKNAGRMNETVEATSFIGEKTYKAKGKRLSNYEIDQIADVTPELPEEEPEIEEEVEEAEPTGEDELNFESESES